MSSRRELLKKANSTTNLNQSDEHDNLTKELKRQYDAHTEEPIVELEKKADIKAESVSSIQVENVAPEIIARNNIIPSIGRPKRLEGTYHNYAARLRSDLFEFAKSQTGEGKLYQSVNEYLNELVMNDYIAKGGK